MSVEGEGGGRKYRARKRDESESGGENEKEDGPSNNKVPKTDDNNRDRDENEVLDQEESDHGSGSESEEYSGKEVKEGRRRVSSSKILKCQCTTVEKQAREIQDLKRKLLQKQVYDEKGSTEPALDANQQDDLWTRMVGLEAKVDTVVKALTSKNEGEDGDDKQGTSKGGKGSDFHIQSLHSKMDKCMRMVLEVTEGLQKTNKFIKQLQKAEEKSEREEEKTKKEEMQKVHSARFSTAGSIKALAQDPAEDKAKKFERTPIQAPTIQEPEKPKEPEAEEKYAWGTNMLLVGDTFWCSFKRLADVQAEVDGMTASVGFRIGQTKDSILISDMYDTIRDCLKFPLPQRFKTVGISVGATDLLTDPDLKTLSDGPIAQIKKTNSAILHRKAHLVKKLAEKLITMGRSVVLVIPPFGKNKREVFQQWREIILSYCSDLALPKFRTLDLYNLMTSTMPQFKDAQEMLDNWMTDQVKLSLSDFGTRKLFDALKRCMWAKTRKSLSNLQFLKETGPQPPSNECLRCTKQHPGGPDTCRSKDRRCRRCGIVGHFDTLHSIMDFDHRRRIVEYLGVDIYESSVNPMNTLPKNVNGTSSEGGVIGPMTERETNESAAAMNSYHPDKLKFYTTSEWHH